MEEILKNIEKQSRQQLLFTKIICFLCAFVLICTLGLMVFIASAVQQIIVYAEPLMELIAKAESVVAKNNNWYVWAGTGTVGIALLAVLVVLRKRTSAES